MIFLCYNSLSRKRKRNKKMAKQKKNSNYVTEKTSAAKAEMEAAKEKELKAKKVKTLVLAIVIPVLAIALIVGILFLTGAFDYDPHPTYHATVTLDNGTSLHIELYGNDAPETVKHFIKLSQENYFNGRSVLSLVDGSLYLGNETADGDKLGIKGEFESNGFDNRIPMRKGVVCMARGDGNNTAYGQFFILTKKNASLKGEYAAFGRMTDTEALDNLLDSLTVNADGSIKDAPKITGISLHAAHD